VKYGRKVCTCCGIEKSLRNFYRRSGGKNGYRSNCKEGHNRSVNENRDLKHEYYTAKMREYRADPVNRAKHNERCKLYAQTERGRESARERRRTYRLIHPERYAQQRRAQWNRRNELRKQLREEARA
jgi:hypothetical protein